MANENNVTISDAKIIFRNFAGKESRFNPPGRRSFAVVLTPELYANLEARGWNVRRRESRDPNGDPLLYLQVFVRFDQYPPKVYRVGHYVDDNGQNQTRILALDGNSAACLDYEDLTTCDMVISPYNWEVNGKTGVKAYLKELYANVDEDPFAGKYGSAANMQGPNGATDDDDGDLPF